jgi:hypothetical protein
MAAPVIVYPSRRVLPSMVLDGGRVPQGSREAHAGFSVATVARGPGRTRRRPDTKTRRFVGRILAGIGFGVTTSAQNPLAGIWFQGSRFTALQTATGAVSCIGVGSAFIVGFGTLHCWNKPSTPPRGAT